VCVLVITLSLSINSSMIQYMKLSNLGNMVLLTALLVLSFAGSATCLPVCGDVTDDGKVNMGDVTLLLNHVSQPSNPRYDICDNVTGDVNGDGNVNFCDVLMLCDHVTYGAPALNCPCRIL